MPYDIKRHPARLQRAIILFVSAAATVAIYWPGRAFAFEGQFIVTVGTSYTATGGGDPATLSIDSARIRAGFIEENSQVRRFRTVDFDVTALRLKPDGHAGGTCPNMRVNVAQVETAGGVQTWEVARGGEMWRQCSDDYVIPEWQVFRDFFRSSAESVFAANRERVKDAVKARVEAAAPFADPAAWAAAFGLTVEIATFIVEAFPTCFHELIVSWMA
jgi:hypothetical protein